MTLGEIKLAALDLMLPNETGVTADTLDTTTDETVKYYLDKMPPVINRCFADLESKGVLGEKDFILQKPSSLMDDTPITRGDSMINVFYIDTDYSGFTNVTLSYAQYGVVVFTKTKSDMTFFDEERDGQTWHCVQVTLTRENTMALSADCPVECGIRASTGDLFASTGTIKMTVDGFMNEGAFV